MGIILYERFQIHKDHIPDSKGHGTNMGPTWVLSAPDGPMLAPWTLLSGTQGHTINQQRDIDWLHVAFRGYLLSVDKGGINRYIVECQMSWL